MLKKFGKYLVNTDAISLVNYKPSDLDGIAVYLQGNCHIFMRNDDAYDQFGMNAEKAFNKYVLGEEDHDCNGATVRSRKHSHDY